MTGKLAALIVEDSASDAALMVRQLVAADFSVQYEVVDHAAALRAALARRSWDVVLADFSLPGFSAGEALEILRELAGDTPMIVVSGVAGDERAIELMRRGARDYVLKDNLARLAEAVRREVREAAERAKARESAADLQRSERNIELLYTALDSAATPIAICDSHGALEWINAAFTACTGFNADEAIGQNLRKLIDSNQNASSLRASQVEQLRKGQSWSGEMINRRKDGTVHPDHVTLTPVRGESGSVSHFIAILHDLTEQKAQEGRLLASQRLEAIGELTGGIAHDFNNLLTVILGNAELLVEQLRGDSKLGPLAEMISGAAERGAGLTSALLAFARRQELAPRVVDINQLIAGTEGLLRRTLGEHLEIRVSQTAGLGHALVDPAELENALLNLCLNARDAMPGGGQLTIETANRHLSEEYASKDLELLPGEYIMIAVSDNGSGIAQEHIELVFEPFFTTKEQGKGTGLGLPRVYGFIKQSGGQINISSAPGQGTTVRMYLPRAGGAPEHDPVADLAPGDARGQETILLVEDDDQVRSYAQGQLVELGYRVIAARDGPAALEALGERADIALLFTDMIMPGGMQGHELAAAARKLRPALKVLCTSGYSASALNSHDGLKAGFRLLWKPYRREDLAREVRAVLDAGPR